MPSGKGLAIQTVDLEQKRAAVGKLEPMRLNVYGRSVRDGEGL